MDCLQLTHPRSGDNPVEEAKEQDRGVLDGISLKLQEEERKRRMDFVPGRLTSPPSTPTTSRSTRKPTTCSTPSMINNTMGEGNTSTRDMSTDKINVDLNEYPIEDISLENGYSGTVSEHFDHDIVANDVLEVEEIETYEKENIVSSSQNIEINEFAEEVDRDETYNETNIVPFVGQIFLSEEEAFAFYKRNYWALAYLRDHFFGGMTTTGRSESINAFIKRFINSHTSLSDFTKQVDVAIDDIKQKEDHDIMLEKCKRINLKLMSPLQEQAHGVLTRFAFQKFQEEFERSTQYSIHHENGNEFVLRYYKDANSRKHMVFWDDCHEIPSNYLPSRWRLQTSHDDDEVDPQQVNVVFEEQVDVVHCPPPSKTKGRPKRRRLKGGKELSHNMNTCGLCKDHVE
ncbi:Protein FAR1-RELATED SEQUENCE 11 [Glycine soja]|nr:Protein FAR1-RELATED SEQUENCE 11 [Glycine soja]